MGKQRKTVATSKRKISKAEKEKRAQQEKQIKLERDELVVPKWMEDDEIARNEFIRIVEAAKKIDLWDNLDLGFIAVYCKAFSSYIDLTKKIDENGYTVQGKETEKISPYVTAQNRYVEQMLRCSSKLGVATTDRLKLIIPEPETKENKFMKYLKV
ncbi:phage terminase small subunit P27 family [Paraclostridium sordellii 8483]|uniref:phage terminase small subunit P27 family n=1 Tax=Paraclostridium sordellii TaxID=1505 RepID=UPI00031C1102|nr:phage terminase small subunit P27 family [Paeniclostridium sordellii]TAN66627.1 phage terminase small subunit P27 family [Paeniclostridium sordellii 8483]